MQNVRKAVITAAGLGTRHLPATAAVQKELFPLVDRDGVTKPTIQIVVEEAMASGVEEFCIVASADSVEPLRRHFELLARRSQAPSGGVKGGEQAWRAECAERIQYAIQPSPAGYGHAVYCARHFVGNDPFLLMLGDHVYVATGERRCARQVMDAFAVQSCAVSGVQRTPAEQLRLFGTVSGRPVSGGQNLYELTEIKEKPTPEYAAAHLVTEGLAVGEYLCFAGLHVFWPSIFDALAFLIRHNIQERGEIQMTAAQELLRTRERYIAVEVEGLRLDMGVPMGYLHTQITLALHSPARDQVLQSVLQNACGTNRGASILGDPGVRGQEPVVTS